MRRLDLIPTNDLISQYRATFSTRSGQEVLRHMLFDLGAFLETRDGDDVILKNYATRLLNILAGGEIGEDSIEQFTKRLMKQPLPKEIKED